MNSKKTENAKGLYLEGIRDGKIAEALNKYTGKRYTQHSTGVGDGKEGFTEFFAPFIERNPVRHIDILRAIEDGQYVFVHAYQNLNNGESQWITADLFDTDDQDRMIEHWDVIQEYTTETKSGRTMVEGSTEVEDLDKTESNKVIVQGFFDDVMLRGEFDRIADYISLEQYHQHNPAIADGIEGFLAYNEEMQKTGTKYWKVHKLIGQGNFVVTLSQVQTGKSHFAVFDIFRLKDRLIVEHWDIQEKILPPEEWNNVGKF